MESLTEVVALRLTLDEYDWLKSTADKHQCSRAALVRQVLLEYKETSARGGACIQVITRRVGRRKND